MLPAEVDLELQTALFGARRIFCEAGHAVAAQAALDVWARYCGQHPEAVSGVFTNGFVAAWSGVSTEMLHLKVQNQAIKPSALT